MVEDTFIHSFIHSIFLDTAEIMKEVQKETEVDENMAVVEDGKTPQTVMPTPSVESQVKILS